MKAIQCLFDWLPQHGGDQSIVSARLSSDKVMLRNSHNEIQMLAGTQLVAVGRQKHLFRNYKAPQCRSEFRTSIIECLKVLIKNTLFWRVLVGAPSRADTIS